MIMILMIEKRNISKCPSVFLVQLGLRLYRKKKKKKQNPCFDAEESVHSYLEIMKEVFGFCVQK